MHRNPVMFRTAHPRRPAALASTGSPETNQSIVSRSGSSKRAFTGRLQPGRAVERLDTLRNDWPALPKRMRRRGNPGKHVQCATATRLRERSRWSSDNHAPDRRAGRTRLFLRVNRNEASTTLRGSRGNWRALVGVCDADPEHCEAWAAPVRRHVRQRQKDLIGW